MLIIVYSLNNLDKKVYYIRVYCLTVQTIYQEEEGEKGVGGVKIYDKQNITKVFITIDV